MHDRDRDVLTTGQVARLCNVAPRTVSKWFDTGQLRGYRIPGSKDRRIPLQQLIRFMKAHGLPLDGLEGDQIRVLIVEPDRDLASLLQDTLGADRRLQVTLATSAFEAGALAQEIQPHVLVLDIDVAGIDAAAITRFMTGRVELQAAHLIATGVGVTPADRSSLLQEGFQAVLPKPYQVREMSQLIEQVLRG